MNVNRNKNSYIAPTANFLNGISLAGPVASGENTGDWDNFPDVDGDSSGKEDFT